MVSIKNIQKWYPNSGNLWRKGHTRILNNVTMDIPDGSCIGLIGESGSGKSTLSRLILGLEKPDGGRVLIEGDPADMWRVHNKGGISVVFQDYTASVNPRYTVEQIIAEPMFACGLKKEAPDRIRYLLKRVDLSESLLTRYPHELSGGQLQRVCISRALSTEPKYIVLDEPLSSLDVSVQSLALDLLIDLRKDGSLTYLFITHDLQTVVRLCDEVYFLYKGEIVEQCDSKHIAHIQNEYARKLFLSVIPFCPS